MPLDAVYDPQVERGWLWYSTEEEVYRLTMKGAYLVTWGLLPPFKWLRVLARTRREREVLRAFDRAGGDKAE